MALVTDHQRVSISSNPADETVESQFTCFPNLPSELQLQIWRHARPDPRSIRRAILFTTDLDFGKIRAIILSIGEIAHYIRVLTENENDLAYNEVDEDEDTIRKQYHQAAKTMYRTPERVAVLAMFHTCRASRTIAREIYRLNIDTVVEEENNPLWNPTEDLVVFLPEISNTNFRRTYNNASQDCERTIPWLSTEWETPPPSLSSLQHFAIFNTNLCTWGFEFDGVAGAANGQEGTMQKCVKNMPSLQSVTLLLDPGHVVSKHDGKMLLYEPEEKLISRFNLFPRDIIDQVTRLFEAELEDKDIVPLVELYVAGRKAPRKARINRKC